MNSYEVNAALALAESKNELTEIPKENQEYKDFFDGLLEDISKAAHLIEQDARRYNEFNFILSNEVYDVSMSEFSKLFVDFF